MPRFHRGLYLFALTLFLLALTARTQLVIQSPEDLGIDINHLEDTFDQPTPASFEMTAPFDAEPSTAGPKLTECLTVERKLSLFYEYVREVAPVVCARFGMWHRDTDPGFE